MNKALIIAAHPDDEVLICGGTAARLVDEGWRVQVMYLTLSDAAAYGKETPENRAVRAKNEAKLAMDILGISEVDVVKFADMFVGDNRGTLIKAMIAGIRVANPNVVFSHSARDFHIDHRTVGELVPEAVYQAARDVCGNLGEKVEEPLLLVGDVDLEIRNFHDPDIVIGIDGYLDKKITALKCYDSLITEHPLFDQTQLEEWCKTVCRARGIFSVNYTYAEGFNKKNITPFLMQEDDLMRLQKCLPK